MSFSGHLNDTVVTAIAEDSSWKIFETVMEEMEIDFPYYDDEKVSEPLLPEATQNDTTQSIIPGMGFRGIFPKIPEICNQGETRMVDGSCRRLRKPRKRRFNARSFYRRYLRKKRSISKASDFK